MHSDEQTFPWADLLSWYEISGRHHLEWRVYVWDDATLGYRIWLAEILLQQTQAERVRVYYTRMLERYPTIHDLAHASYDEFFPYYQGLGYYSRARNILRTASIVSHEYAGVFPREKSLLQTLPGVWWYTSSAILAFGYGEPYLAWDTNLEKVFARYYHGRKDEKLTDREKELIEEDFREYICSHSPHDTGELEGVQKQSITHPSLPFSGKEGGEEIHSFSGISRAINNALMDFASIVDLKNPALIDWDHYPLQSGLWYETHWALEPIEAKKSSVFPIPDATVMVILHEGHKVYYSEPIEQVSPPYDSVIPAHAGIQANTSCPPDTLDSVTSTEWQVQYTPFILPPSLSRDTRWYVQEYFREQYGLEVSVRPVHEKWMSTDGRPYIAVNAQIQTGRADFQKYTKKDVEKYFIDRDKHLS